MRKVKLVGRILLIALGVLIVWFGVNSLIVVVEVRQTLGQAVYLEEPVALPENEGKTVIIHGKVEMTEPAYDDELGLTLDTIKAFRYDEEYESAYNEDDEMVYKWRTKEMKSFVGKAKMGEFELDASVLSVFPTESERYSDFDPKEIGKYGTEWRTYHTYVLVDAYMYYPETDNLRHGREHAGDRVSYYRYYDPSAHEEMTTVVAVQRGNVLTAHEKSGAIVEDGVWSREELMKKQMGVGFAASILFIVGGLVPVFSGLRGFLKPKSKKKGKKRKKR